MSCALNYRENATSGKPEKILFCFVSDFPRISKASLTALLILVFKLLLSHPGSSSLKQYIEHSTNREDLRFLWTDSDRVQAGRHLK